MNEDFLHYVWKFKLFSKTDLVTTEKESLIVLKSGIHNKNSGPDFLNAQLKITNQTWAGNVEIHVKASDWYLHNHEIDVNYDAVILHVVWEDDASVFMKNNKKIPTLELKNSIDKIVLQNYKNLFSNQLRWIPCQSEIKMVDSFTIENWIERLFFERLERKADDIKLILVKEHTNFEAVLFQLIVRNFGLKVNGDAFFSLATSVDFSVVKKCTFNEIEFAALLFGQAGFLEDDLQDEYHQQLKQNYTFLKHKFNLQPLSKNMFSFFRMRPNNFPTIRIAQLVSLFVKQQHLFSKLMEANCLDDFYDLFSVDVQPFWKTHYTFEKVSKSSTKKLTKSFIDLLIINTIIPLKFLYQKSRGEVDVSSILKIIQQIKPEKNSIISKFSEIGITSKNALETQALLELKNNYCAPKHCLECAIGKHILKKN